MVLDPAELAYFRRGEQENPRFWSRFGGPPPLTGARVLDVGCGHGSLCIDMAQRGAGAVVGLDLNSKLVAFAGANLEQNHAAWAGVVSFFNLDLRDYPKETFDYIVSKDTFEHILDLPGMLREIKLRLRPGGRVYTGFGPLYNSPFGDHGTARLPIPWGHLIIGDEQLIARVNRRRRQKVHTIQDLGLNRLAFADYRRIFAESGFEILLFATNRSTRLSSRLFSTMRLLPPLTEYFTHNIYCILQNH